MTAQDVIAQEQQYIVQTYKRFPVVLTKGEGVRVWDIDGKCYLDCLAGIAVNALGYNHPAIREAIRRQSEGLIHTSNLFYTQNQLRLAQLLVEHSELDCAFYCNSGAEANEAAFKLARKWGKGRYEILTAQQSFHGRTLAAITATGQTKYQQDFEPLMPGFKHVPFNDLDALRNAVTPQTVGILLEAIQGEGGIRLADPAYMQGVADLCRTQNLLLMFDEVQAGLGRTGKLFAYQQYGVRPDIITLAKSLGGGFPIGMMLARRDVAEAFQFGDHASTFGGGEFVTGIALTFLELLLHDHLLDHVAEMGTLLIDRLNSLKAAYPAMITDARGMGLMAGLEFHESIAAADVCVAARENGLLTATAGGNVLRFVPPLIIQPADIEEAGTILEKTLSAMA
ncbi:acetylornithine/succinylornithine family transaminase [candidate division KSB3 bacterium]|uniref:Acetylornithine aminotransferase n=1 Tax=candidate division KSB3 bacterium TaxID=2044937 RepID=A0A9D5Q6X1_9BACT|nr:acetylornithine/succinylornithine family transaminase [candidate division KSB3 bacterium]MBD3325677.1 acetylornithine/succinylornithine family transaminase [candidate division KSB3 bacterium]